MAEKILVIGLDGATFDVINPLIEEGRMPNLQELIQQGASGTLQSTMPPVTGPAWQALATGRTPGKTGIFDFIIREGEKGYKFRFLNSSDFVNRAIWDILSSAGKKVGIINYPCLYPPYKINGFMVSGGIGSPDLSDFTYPKSIEKEIINIIGNKRQLNLKDPKYKNLDIFLKDLNESFRKNLEATEYLLKEKEWDFAWVVFSETDWIQHMMWKYFDKNESSSDIPDFKKYNHRFKEFWARVDEGVGRIKKYTDNETNIVVVSDHGFGPINQSFKLNAWLKHEGYLKLKRGGWKGFIIMSKGRKILRNIAKMLLINKISPNLFTWGKKATVSMMIPLHFIDYEKTNAFDPGHIGSMGGIYINSRNLDDNQDHEEIRNEITEKLKNYGIQNGLEIEIFRPEDIYGEKAIGSLDLILRINNGRCIILKEFEGKIVEYNKLPSRISFLNGTHRMNGIFIASGPDFIYEEVKDANLWDISPTILKCFNESIPSWMQGKILDEVLNPKIKTRHNEPQSQIYENKTKKSLTKEEEERIKKQLRDLGYF